METFWFEAGFGYFFGAKWCKRNVFTLQESCDLQQKIQG